MKYKNTQIFAEVRLRPHFAKLYPAKKKTESPYLRLNYMYVVIFEAK